MTPHAGFGGGGRLIHVYLLDRLAGRGLLPAADGVVEDDDFFDAGEFGAEELLDFGVITVADGGIVGEGFLMCWGVVDGEAGCVGSEVGFVAADVGDGALVIDLFEGLSGAVDFGPGFDEGFSAVSVRGWIDVFEHAGCHCGCLAG